MQDRQSMLIIEDAKDLVDLLVRRFRADYETIYALDGREGIEKAKQGRPDIVLLDVNLPDMSGFDVLSELKASEETLDIPVLMMTALSDTENVLTGFKMGAEDYLVKPFNFAELSARVRAHLTIRQLQKRLIDIERLNTLREAAVSFSHEINNPLMSISTFAHAMRMRAACGGCKDCVECGEMVEGILGEVDRIAGSVRLLSKATSTNTVDYQPGIKMIDINKLKEE